MKTFLKLIIFVCLTLWGSACRQSIEPVKPTELELTPAQMFSSKVMRPNFEDNLIAGMPFTVHWDLEFEGGFVNIHLYQNDDFIYTIVTNTKNDRRFKWGIPEDLPLSSVYKIKVENAADPDDYGFSTKFRVDNN